MTRRVGEDLEKRRVRAARYYEQNKHVWQNPDGSWKKANITPERQREINRASYQRHREKRLEKSKRKYLERARVGTCPICEAPDVKLVWDHDHQTGVHRAWICHACNLVLGHARDDAKVLRRAAEYLEVHGSTPLPISRFRVPKTTTEN